ncbi:hypothetical protein V3F56_14450 [Moorellaceae bacterium AZ2]
MSNVTTQVTQGVRKEVDVWSMPSNKVESWKRCNELLKKCEYDTLALIGRELEVLLTVLQKQKPTEYDRLVQVLSQVDRGYDCWKRIQVHLNTLDHLTIAEYEANSARRP